MVCILGFYKRRPELSPAAFHDHWRNIHGPLIRDTPNVARHILRYVQHHLGELADPRLPAIDGIGYDGFSETWFADLDAFETMLAEPDFRQIVHVDAARFVDLTATRVAVIDEPHRVI